MDYSAFARKHGEGMGVFYGAPLDLSPDRDPMFGVSKGYEHLLSDVLNIIIE